MRFLKRGQKAKQRRELSHASGQVLGQTKMRRKTIQKGGGGIYNSLITGIKEDISLQKKHQPSSLCARAVAVLMRVWMPRWVRCEGRVAFSGDWASLNALFIELL